MPGAFSGEDQHRLAHRRLGPMLRDRLGEDAPRVVHESGDIDAVVARCRRAEGRPEVLVLPAFRDHVWRSLEATLTLAEHVPDLPVLLSGWGADPDYIDAILQGRKLSHPRFAVVRGEVEEGLVDALETLAHSPTFPTDALQRHGLAIPDPNGGWRSRGTFRAVSDLARLPSPYLSGALKPEDMDGMVLVEVARGCLFRCHFCLSCNYPRQEPRPFPLARIHAEIEYAARHRARSVGLLCSGLNYDLEVLESVAAAFEAIPEETRPLVESTVHLSLLDEPRLQAVMRLPWQRMIVGLQSTNPAALALMHRQVDLERFREAIERVATVHTPVVELILGLPGDTLEGFVSTMRYVLELPVDIEVYHLRLDPGSLFMRDREQLGLEADFSDEGRVLSTPTFSAKGLERAKWALRELGVRPWRYRAKRLGFDFQRIYDAGQQRRRDEERRRTR
jgi:Radical SAM superfamily